MGEALELDSMMFGLVCILIMVVMILFGVNIGMAMFAVGFFGMTQVTSWKAALSMFKMVPFTQSSNYALVVIPLFVLMGQAAYKSGMSNGLFDASQKCLSRMPGSLSLATIAAAAVFSSICGSTVATSATMSTIAMPEMRKYGYSDGLATGCIVAGGTLGVLIPPSTVFILYGIVAEQSIGRLFAAGVVPGVILAFFYMLTVVIICKVRPESAPPSRGFSWKERLVSLKGLGPALILFVVVIGGMFSGTFTANEASAVGAVLGIAFMGVNRKLTRKNLSDCLLETIKTTAMIFQVLLAAYVLNYFLSASMLPTNLAKYIVSLDLNRYLVVAMIMVIFLILGCLMDSLPLVLLTVPIFLPIITQLGFDPIWYGVLMVLASDQGVMTPPVGLNVFVVAGMVKDVPMSTIFKGTIPFVAAIFICIIIVIAFPELSLWLPNLIYG